MHENTRIKALGLRKALNALAEVSMQEARTRAYIEKFLRGNTSLEIHIEDGWLWAMHREANADKTIAFRADFDAVATGETAAAHLCGHDGHAAALCAFALEMEGKIYGKNICLIFQHAEETGQGGAVCAELIDRIKIEEVYGCHSLPGYPFGAICLKKGSFACASRGLIIRMQGKSAHAAYPENGRNPAPALCELAVRLAEFTNAAYDGMVMATLIGIRCGQKAFGMAASDGEIYLTLRAHLNRDLDALENRIIAFCREKAEKGGFGLAYEHIDAFPGTENDDRCTEKLEKAAQAAGYHLHTLQEPMRWSEDFGWYLMKCPGAYFGVGAGEDYPALHTPEFEYRDELIEYTVTMFEKIAEL